MTAACGKVQGGTLGGPKSFFRVWSGVVLSVCPKNREMVKYIHMAKIVKPSKKREDFYKYHEPVDFRDTWRVFKIMSEFVEGYQFLSGFRGEVAVFGSARTNPRDKNYKAAVELGKLLGKNKNTVITGGGPGIMEAANRGAYEAGGESVGLNIQLPHEQVLNPYAKKSLGFHYFFTRKVMLTTSAQAFAFFPGGFGTMDEFFEVLDYIDSKKMDQVPVLAYNSDFWGELEQFLREYAMKRVRALDEHHLRLFKIMDTPEEMFKEIKKTSERPYFSDLSPQQFSTGEAANWKIFRIMSELVEGFDFIDGIKNNITILGTNHLGQNSGYYEQAYELSKKLGKNGYSILTGGGWGIMEAANKGAKEAGADSIGLLVRWNQEFRKNDYLTKSIAFSFPFTRKLVITAPTLGFIIFPGGYGTMHQFFELLVLVQTKKMAKMPLILFGKEYWKPLISYIKKYFCEKYKTIEKIDLNLFYIVDKPDEAVDIIKKFKRR